MKIWLFAVIVFISGCVSNEIRTTDSYSKSLYSYYKYPQKREFLIEKLVTQISDYELKGRRAPPGLCAELGTFLLEAGDYDRAVVYYRKELDYWPDSTILMTALISSLENRRAKTR